MKHIGLEELGFKQIIANDFDNIVDGLRHWGRTMHEKDKGHYFPLHILEFNFMSWAVV